MLNADFPSRQLQSLSGKLGVQPLTDSLQDDGDAFQFYKKKHFLIIGFITV